MDVYSCACLWCCSFFKKDDFTAVSQAFPTLQSSHVQVSTGEGGFHHGILFRQHGGALWSWLEIFKKIPAFRAKKRYPRKSTSFHKISKSQKQPLNQHWGGTFSSKSSQKRHDDKAGSHSRNACRLTHLGDLNGRHFDGSNVDLRPFRLVTWKT